MPERRGYFLPDSDEALRAAIRSFPRLTPRGYALTAEVFDEKPEDYKPGRWCENMRIAMSNPRLSGARVVFGCVCTGIPHVNGIAVPRAWLLSSFGHDIVDPALLSDIHYVDDRTDMRDKAYDFLYIPWGVYRGTEFENASEDSFFMDEVFWKKIEDLGYRRSRIHLVCDTVGSTGHSFCRGLEDYIAFVENKHEDWMRAGCDSFPTPSRYRLPGPEKWVHVWDEETFFRSRVPNDPSLFNPLDNFFVVLADGSWGAMWLDHKFGAVYPECATRRKHVHVIRRDNSGDIERLIGDILSSLYL